MTTDPITREDLEMAARAAGLPVLPRRAGSRYMVALLVEESSDEGLWYEWHPGEDDGDCARMEDAVVIDLFRISSGIYAERRDLHIAIFAKFADHANDRSRARRYASVKLAAAVGRAM